MKFLLLLTWMGSFALVAGCGAQRPFSRGKTNPTATSSGPGNPAKTEGPQNGAESSVAQPLRRDIYDQKIRPLLHEACASCHDNPGVDYEKALQFSKAGFPEQSSLYTKTIGTDHGGGAIFEVGSAEEKLLRSWILGTL